MILILDAHNVIHEEGDRDDLPKNNRINLWELNRIILSRARTAARS